MPVRNPSSILLRGDSGPGQRHRAALGAIHRSNGQQYPTANKGIRKVMAGIVWVTAAPSAWPSPRPLWLWPQ